MRRTATTIAVCALVGSAGTAVAVAACPPGEGNGPTDTTGTTTTGSASSAVREYEGTVIGKSTGKFRLRTDGGKKVTIKVKKSTDFGEGVSGLRSLKKGDEAEVKARKTRNGLVATDVGCPNKGGDNEEGETGDQGAPPARHAPPAS